MVFLLFLQPCFGFLEFGPVAVLKESTFCDGLSKRRGGGVEMAREVGRADS